MKIYLASFLFINFLIAQNESISLENQNIATPVNLINAPDGFEVELLYSVPSDQQGSWVALCIDDLGRIIASDQYGGLYRFQPPELGKTLDSSSIKKIPVDLQNTLIKNLQSEKKKNQNPENLTFFKKLSEIDPAGTETPQLCPNHPSGILGPRNQLLLLFLDFSDFTNFIT